MDRRGFLKATAGAGVVGGAAHAAPGVALAPAKKAPSASPPILASFGAADHRRRLENIALCRQEIRTCMRRHLITDYLPAQCVYNMGEYPSRQRWEPGEYDEQELDRLKAHGIQLIHVMDEWNDRYGMFGGNKLTAVNPQGFRRFVTMVHDRGMKILAYASSGYFVGSDPDYCKEWSRPGDEFGGWWDLTRCSPASPGWRAHFLPRMVQILEDYELDGLYNDWGYIPNAQKRAKGPAPDDVVAFEETPDYDGAVTDLLCLIYAEVKRRGGIYKMHADRANVPQTGGLKVYDYLWVGEGVRNAEGLREAVKNHPPYVVPCIDMSQAKIADRDEPYLHAIPYMQFPLLQGGRPLTGERAVVPIPRLPGKQERSFYRRAWEYYQAHPNGPYIYGGWDSIPPNPETRPIHARWLKQYLPLTADGTWAFLEIGDSKLFAAPLPKGVVASAFANRDLYLVVANYGPTPIELATTANYLSADQTVPTTTNRWSLPPRSVRILRRSA